MLNFKTTSTDHDLILKIAERAEKSPYWNQPRMTTAMDLSAANNDTPLNLEVLLGFDELDFWHDIQGISTHINRNTGKLEDFFSPRCARQYHP